MTADQLLNALFNAGIAISVGATVLSLGMTYTTAQLMAPLKRVWLVVAVVVNAVAIPAIAWLVAEALPISDVYVSGLVLATLGAGSAAALKGAQPAERADLPLAVSLVVVLQLSNIVAVPRGRHRRQLGRDRRDVRLLGPRRKPRHHRGGPAAGSPRRGP